MWLYLVQGMGFGLAAAIQPGPFQTYIISQTLTKGWQKMLPAALAPLVSDAPIILLCLFVISQIPLWAQRFLYLAGGTFIIYLAYGTFVAWRKFEADIQVQEDSAQQSILKAALTNILNPNPYIYWSLVTGPILLEGWRETPVHGIGFLASFNDYHHLWHGASAWAEGQSCIAGNIRGRFILFRIVSIMAQYHLAQEKELPNANRPCACECQTEIYRRVQEGDNRECQQQRQRAGDCALRCHSIE
jgi:threonine/homoserine/homoserine lactone efflux protein